MERGRGGITNNAIKYPDGMKGEEQGKDSVALSQGEYDYKTQYIHVSRGWIR